MTDTPGKFRGDVLHHGIAEQGKLYSLEGDHLKALAYYREAMRLAVANRAPEVFFRHYLECSLESLELLGHLDDVLAYCQRAIDHYNENPPKNALARRDLASIHLRHGLVLLKAGDKEESRRSLERARQLSGDKPGTLPLGNAVLGWLRVGLHITPDRITAEQHRQGYFSVRRETVRPDKAIRLPDKHMAEATTA